jgi:glycosyltransferase involved in cell wall biosynthesis
MKIAWLSDLDISGSGYMNISIPLCEGLTRLGHDVKCSAMNYDGSEHYYNFSLIPCQNYMEGIAVVQNLYNLWHFDVLVVALDIPIQENLLNKMRTKPPFKYVGIMPVEADPLCLSWAMALQMMDKQMIISEFGTEECHKVGITSAVHLPVGIDTQAWRIPAAEERAKFRKTLGFEEDTYAVLTVADNQERKNLSHAMEAFAKFAEDKPDARYVLVTREFLPIGWRLRDLAAEFGIGDKMVIIERGIPFGDLWAIFAACDVFLLPSKAEGLGMPLLEAMSVGLPCIATNATGMAELLKHERGTLVDYDYVHRDPFGNGRRYWISVKDLTFKLNFVYSHMDTINIDKARKYVMGRTWEKCVHVLNDELMKLVEKLE